MEGDDEETVEAKNKVEKAVKELQNKRRVRRRRVGCRYCCLGLTSSIPPLPTAPSSLLLLLILLLLLLILLLLLLLHNEKTKRFFVVLESRLKEKKGKALKYFMAHIEGNRKGTVTADKMAEVAIQVVVVVVVVVVASLLVVLPLVLLLILRLYPTSLLTSCRRC